jgi:DNA-binding cell septation regulator SpoVG
MVSALNFKPYDKGSLRGFLDLRYHGLTIRGCRLMTGDKGLWIALPQQKIEQDGETKYIEQLYLTAPEAQHVRAIVLADLEHQGHIQRPATEKPRQSHQKPSFRTPEGEDLSEYRSQPDEDIPF